MPLIQRVASRILTLRALGDRPTLARAKAPIEVGVLRPITKRQLALWEAIEDLLESGKSLEEVRRTLIKKRAIPTMSHQAFRKRLAALEVERPSRRPSSAPSVAILLRRRRPKS
jgi:hypothetical protein